MRSRLEVTVVGGCAREETLDRLLDRWLGSRQDVRDVTLQGYRDVLVPVRARLGSRAVCEVGVDDVAELADWMARAGGRRGQGLSPRTVAAALGALAQAVDLAVAEGTLSGNVARSVPRPRAERLRTGARWTPRDIAAFREVASEDRLAAAWLLALAGMRRSEVLGLRWEDVDLRTGAVRVEVVRVAVTPRSASLHALHKHASLRTVPAGHIPGILPALRRLRTQQAAERLAAGPAYVESGFVVVDKEGSPVRPEWFSDRFKALRVAARVPPIPMHSLRHAAVLVLREAGIPAVCIAEWLGMDLADVDDAAGHRYVSMDQRVDTAR